MSKYVLSTMTSNVGYALYDMIGDLPVLRRKIRIFGGAGIPSETSGVGDITRNHDGKPLWTPSGVVTTVSDEDAEILRNHPVFSKHHDAGYVKFVHGDISHSTREMDKATNNMKRDGFQQLTKETLKSRVKVTIGNKNEDDHRI